LFDEENNPKFYPKLIQKIMYHYEDEPTVVYENESILQGIGEYVLAPEGTGNDPNGNLPETTQTPRQTIPPIIEDDCDDDGHYSLARPGTCPTQGHGVLQIATPEIKPKPKEGFLEKKSVKISAGVVLFVLIAGGVAGAIVLTHQTGITNVFILFEQ
jgi:hypothetical protein